MKIKALFRELKRRNIYKVGVVYAITAWVVVQVASVAADTFGAPAWVMKMIITVVLLGFPVALVIAWAFEITPEGLRRTQTANSETGESAATPDDRRFWVGIGVITLLLLGGWWIYERPLGDGTATDGPGKITDRSIAILPLKSNTGNEDLPLAQGLHDDLLTRLSNISDLQVKSRTTVDNFRDSDLTMPQIADSIGARWIMEGSVYHVGDQARINAQLIDPRTDEHIWSDTYQREINPEQLFAVQGEIAREIADALHAQLSAGEQERISGAPTQNMAAYNLYVKGRKELARYSGTHPDAAKNAMEFFQKAVNIDSTFALAWTGIADAIGLSSPEIYPESGLASRYTQDEAARKALKLEPNLAEGHTSLGLYHLTNQNAPAAIRQFKKAVQLKPSNWAAHNWLGFIYLLTDRLPQALEHLEIAVNLNPQHAWARHGLYDAYLADGQAQKSLEEARLQQRMGLENTGAIGGEVRALYNLDRLEEARSILEEQVARLDVDHPWGSWFRAYMVGIAAAQGDTATAQKFLGQLERADVSAMKLANAYACIGDYDAALDTYNSMTEEDYTHLGFNVEMRYGILFDLEPMKDDPRYRQIIRKANRAWALNPDGSLPERTE